MRPRSPRRSPTWRTGRRSGEPSSARRVARSPMSAFRCAPGQTGSLACTNARSRRGDRRRRRVVDRPWRRSGSAGGAADRECGYLSPTMPSIVLILPESSYRADDFLSAARRLGLRVITASDRCHVLAEEWTEGSLPLDFTNPESAARKLAEEVKAEAPVAVLGTDDR